MYQEQLGFTESVKRAFGSDYCKFTGRASRSEYWWFALFNFIVYAIIATIFNPNGSTYSIITGIYGLVVLLPSIGLSIRRMHDIGRSGWWILINLVPVVGWIVFIVFACQPSQPQENQYGPVPNMV